MEKGKRKIIFVMLVIIFLLVSTLAPSSLASIKTDNSKKIKKTKLVENKIVTNILSKFLSKVIKPIKSLFDSIIHTNCNGLEKSTSISFYSYKEIDVDNNPDTGVDGADIGVQFKILPWIELEFDIGLGLIFQIKVDRLGEEIEENEFSISLEIGEGDLNFGYFSPDETGNKIPDSTEVTFKIYIYLFGRTNGYEMTINPEYSDGNSNKKIELFAEYNEEEITRGYSFEFNPAVSTEISYETTKKQGVWDYSFDRKTSTPTILTSTFSNTQNSVTKETTIIIDKLPSYLNFDLGITPLTQGGGSFLYESNEMYNIEMSVQTSELGSLGYSFLKNTPRKLYAEWTPTIQNGRYHLEIDSDGTDFFLKDSEYSPVIDLKVNNVEKIGFTAYWNLTNPGDFVIYKNTDLVVDLDFKLGNWIAELTTQQTADYIYAKWYIDTEGYFIVDTDWKALSTVDLLLEGPTVGLHTLGETFKAKDFRIDWTLWPPQEWNLMVTGDLSFFSVSIDVKLNSIWRHLWPW